MERNWWCFQNFLERMQGKRYQETLDDVIKHVNIMEDGCARCQDQTSALQMLLRHKWVRKLFGQGACETCNWVGASGRWIDVYKLASKHSETHEERNAWNVLMLGIQTTLRLTQIGRVAWFKLPTELAMGKSGKLEKTLAIFLTFKGFAKPQIDPFPAIRAVSLNALFWFSYRRMSTSNYHVMIPAIGWVENRSRKQVSCIVQKFYQNRISTEFLVVE